MTEDKSITSRKRIVRDSHTLSEGINGGNDPVATLAQEDIAALSEIITSADNSEQREAVIGRLVDLACNGCAEPLFKVWSITRHPRLTEALTEGGFVSDFPYRLKVLRLLESGRLDEIINGAPTLVGPLVDALEDPEHTIRERAAQCLEQLHDPDGIDALAAKWMETGTAFLHSLMKRRELIAQRPAAARVLTALISERSDLVAEMGSEAVEPLLEACAHADCQVSQAARAALFCLRNQDAVDALCMAWAHQRREELNHVVEEAGYVAATPPAIRALSALKAGRTHTLAGDGTECIYPLVLATGDADPEVSQRAEQCLEDLLTGAGAQDALCRAVIEHGNDRAEEIAVAKGLKPSDTALRSLYYFLTEQWTEYEALDFDMSLLREAYEKAGKSLRSRISAKARRAGRLELVELVSGMRHKRRMGEMTLREWEITLGIIDDRQDWETMWRLAQTGPAVWAARALAKLNEVGWKPGRPDEGEGFDRLSHLAARCKTEAPILGMIDRPLSKFRAHGRRVSALIINSYFDSSLATGSWDGTVSIWSMPDGDLLTTLPAHRHPLTSLAATPDGSVLVSGCGAESAAILWSMPEGTPIRRLDGHKKGIAALSISPDGRLLAAGGYDGSTRLWRLRDGALMDVLRGHDRAVKCTRFSPNGRIVATGGEDGKIRLHGVSGSQEEIVLHGHQGTVRALAFTPEGDILASAGYDEHVLLWSMPDGILRKRLAGHANVVGTLAVSGDGRILASGSHDRTVRLWVLPEGRPWGTLEEHAAAVTCLATDPESRVLVSGSHDCHVMMWNFQSGIFRRPTTREDLDRMEELKASPSTPGEANWLDFLVAQMKWRWRFDIEVDTGPGRIEIGEFDIEIAG